MGKPQKTLFILTFAISQAAKAFTRKQLIALFLIAAFVMFPMLAPFYVAQANPQKDNPEIIQDEGGQLNSLVPVSTNQETVETSLTTPVDTQPTQINPETHISDSSYMQRLTCEDVNQFAERFKELRFRAQQRDDLKVALSQEQQSTLEGTIALATNDAQNEPVSPLSNAILQHEQRIARGQDALIRTVANWAKWEEALGTPPERKGILSGLSTCLAQLNTSSEQCTLDDVNSLVSAFNQELLPTDGAYAGHRNICELRNTYWQQTASQRIAANGIEFSPSFLYRGTGCYYSNSVSMIVTPDGASASVLFHDFEARVFSPEECRVRIPVVVDGGPERNAIKIVLTSYYSGMLYSSATARVSTTGTLTGNGMAASGSGSDVAFGFTVYPHKSGVVDTRVRGSLVRNESHTGVLETTTDAYVLSNSPSVLFPDYINPDSLEISGQTYTSDASYSIRFQGKTWLVTITALGAVLIHLVS